MTADPDISRQDPTQPQVLGVLALELSDDSVPARAALAQLAGGRLRVLPYLFVGEPAATAAVAEHMESMLLDLGMAKADTARARRKPSARASNTPAISPSTTCWR